MRLNFAPRGVIQIDEARIVSAYRNFSGIGSKYNREGDRNFSFAIDDQEIADALIAEGWNVKIKAPREEGDTPFMYLSVKVKYNGNGPYVYLVSNGNKVLLNEDTISCLDQVNIDYANLDVNPHDWEANGKTGRAAYLHAMEVYQRVDDRFAPNTDGSKW